MMDYGVMNGWAWLWMLVPALLLFTVIGLSLWFAFRATGTQERIAESSALSILERRFASGEISREEFNDARHTLKLA